MRLFYEWENLKYHFSFNFEEFCVQPNGSQKHFEPLVKQLMLDLPHYNLCGPEELQF